MSEASYQRWLQRWEEKDKAQFDADERGLKLLLETLDDFQLTLFQIQAATQDPAFIPIIGRFCNYHISNHTTLCFGTAPSTVFCLHPGSYLNQHDLYPKWDYMAMHKLMIDAEEETFLWQGNQQLPSPAISKVVGEEMRKLKHWVALMAEMDLSESTHQLVRLYQEGLARKSFEPHPLAGTLIPTTERPLCHEQMLSVVSVLRGHND